MSNLSACDKCGVLYLAFTGTRVTIILAAAFNYGPGQAISWMNQSKKCVFHLNSFLRPFITNLAANRDSDDERVCWQNTPLQILLDTASL